MNSETNDAVPYENPEDKIRRIADVLSFLDFAFPGAVTVEFNEKDATEFTVHIENILNESVRQLILPKLWADEEKRIDYSHREKRFSLAFRFPVAVWPKMLPLFFMPVTHRQPDQISATEVSALLLGIAGSTVDGRNYQEWITQSTTEE